jgi:hypothetical protein
MPTAPSCAPRPLSPVDLRKFLEIASSQAALNREQTDFIEKMALCDAGAFAGRRAGPCCSLGRSRSWGECARYQFFKLDRGGRRSAEAADARADVAARHSVRPYCATTHFFSRGSREMGRRLEWNCLLTAVVAVIRVQGPRRHEACGRGDMIDMQSLLWCGARDKRHLFFLRRNICNESSVPWHLE